MQNPIVNMLMTQIRAKNPQIFQTIIQAQKNQNNPQELINNVIGNYNPAQINRFRQYANGFGISNEELDKFGINAK